MRTSRPVEGDRAPAAEELEQSAREASERAGRRAGTFIGNIPLNDGLGAYQDISAGVATAAREDFEGPWNDLNLLRTLTAIGALACAALATTFTRDR